MATGVQTQVGRFVWHECNTTDIEKSKSFYTELFGWELEVFKPGEIDYPMISVGGATHGGFGALEPGSGTPAHWLGVVWVESVDATVDKAKASGGNVLREAMDMPEVGRFAVIADPAGAAVSIYQPEGEGPVSEGVFVWDELVTSDVEAAKAFYTKVLGWTTADMDMGEAGVYTLLRSGEADRAGIYEEAGRHGGRTGRLADVHRRRRRRCDGDARRRARRTGVPAALRRGGRGTAGRPRGPGRGRVRDLQADGPLDD